MVRRYLTKGGLVNGFEPRESLQVPDEASVPTLAEFWEFLVDLKETTEAGFARMSSEMIGLRTEIRGDLVSLESSLRSDLSRIEARVTRIESWNLGRRFDALEQRVARLEQT